MPKCLDLGLLSGENFRITTFFEPGPRGVLGRTLVVSGTDGRVWLVVHQGEVFEQRHTFEGLELKVALSQRDGGGLIVGTRQLQSLLAVGESARVRDDDHEFIVSFTARTSAGASYVIADASLWRK